MTKYIAKELESQDELEKKNIGLAKASSSRKSVSGSVPLISLRQSRKPIDWQERPEHAKPISGRTRDLGSSGHRELVRVLSSG